MTSITKQQQQQFIVLNTTTDHQKQQPTTNTNNNKRRKTMIQHAEQLSIANSPPASSILSSELHTTKPLEPPPAPRPQKKGLMFRPRNKQEVSVPNPIPAFLYMPDLSEDISGDTNDDDIDVPSSSHSAVKLSPKRESNRDIISQALALDEENKEPPQGVWEIRAVTPTGSFSSTGKKSSTTPATYYCQEWQPARLAFHESKYYNNSPRVVL